MKMTLLALALCAGTLSAAQPCNNATVEGDYGLQFTGIRPSAPGGPFEQVIGIVFRHYDGDGNFTETHTVKGSITGLAPVEQGNGTYQVNADCSGSSTLLPASNRPFPITESFVAVDDGDEMLGIATQPPPLVASFIAKRVSGKRHAAIAAGLADVQEGVAAIARRQGLIPMR